MFEHMEHRYTIKRRGGVLRFIEAGTDLDMKTIFNSGDSGRLPRGIESPNVQPPLLHQCEENSGAASDVQERLRSTRLCTCAQGLDNNADVITQYHSPVPLLKAAEHSRTGVMPVLWRIEGADLRTFGLWIEKKAAAVPAPAQEKFAIRRFEQKIDAAQDCRCGRGTQADGAVHSTMKRSTILRSNGVGLPAETEGLNVHFLTASIAAVFISLN